MFSYSAAGALFSIDIWNQPVQITLAMGEKFAIEPCIESLDTTTFCGRRFTRNQIAQIQDTVRTFQNLSRRELALTLCEHLCWFAPNGAHKIPACLSLLTELEKRGVISLPQKRSSPTQKRAPSKIENAQWETPVQGALEMLGQI